MFREMPWLINPTGVVMILACPILLPAFIIFRYWEEAKEFCIDYFKEAWNAATFTGFKTDE